MEARPSALWNVQEASRRFHGLISDPLRRGADDPASLASDMRPRDRPPELEK
jgi:hypothetical protein